MIPIQIPPADQTLPNFPLLFDGDAMSELLVRHAAIQPGVEITGCRPTYVRYKPGTSCLISYEIDLRTGDGTKPRLAHIKTFADDRGQRRMRSSKLRKLINRATDDMGAPEMTWATYIPELNGVFNLFPVDYDLRPLVKIGTAASASKHIRRTIGVPTLDLSREPEMIRYKPGRKALFRYDTDRGVIYGKIHTDNRGEAIRVATEALMDAGLVTPQVLGTDEDLGLIAHAEAPGNQLASLRGDARYTKLLADLAEPLALMHRTPVEGLQVHHLGHEVDRLRETADLLGVILPNQRERLRRIVCILEDRLARVDDELATNHGDFYDDQAMVDGDRIAIIDLDEIRVAHPMLDIGNMLAHLRTGEARGSVSPEARETFIGGMRQHRAMDERDIATFEAVGMLKLAPGPFRRLEPGWPDAIDGMLNLIEGILAMRPDAPVAEDVRASTPVAGHSGSTVLPNADEGRQCLRARRPLQQSVADTSVPPDLAARTVSGVVSPQTSCGGTALVDDKLPELPTLQDPARMQCALREATGDDALVLDGIHIQRHKQGRRAIIRYDIAGEAPIWGKIFASKRGPRVYEITRTICDAKAFGLEVALPDPVAFLPDLRVLLQRSVPGESITPSLLAGNTALAERIADAIHALHTSGLQLGREHDLDKELSPLLARVDDLHTLFPTLGEEAMALHAQLLDMAGSIQTWRSRPIHRDFYDAQVLVAGDRLSVLDLDDAAMSEPAIDIANFAAHLDLMALQQPDHADRIIRARDHFLARSRTLDPALDEWLMTFLTASTLLRLAGIHAPRHDGERIAAGLLQAAQTTISQITSYRTAS